MIVSLLPHMMLAQCLLLDVESVESLKHLSLVRFLDYNLKNEQGNHS